MATVGLGRQQERRDVDAAHQRAADAVWALLTTGYGPEGSHFLLDMDDDVQILQNASSGLSEQELRPSMVPFQEVVRSVRSAVGDQATAAGLLASGLVRRGLEAESSGLARHALLDGLILARRQALASIDALARESSPTKALQTASRLEPETAAMVVTGLESLAADGRGTVSLDDVDVRVESAASAQWTEGLVVEPQHGPDVERASDVGVVVVDGGWTIKPRTDGMTRRIRSPHGAQDALSEETAMRRMVLEHLVNLGVRLVVCGGAVDESLCLDAARAGMWVWTDAPKDARRRLAASTTATSTVDLNHVDGECLGRADVHRRPRRRGGYWAIGPAPAATLILPADLPILQTAIAEDGERLLRAAGAVMPLPSVVPGGGAWQRHLARGLSGAARHAPGKAGLGVDVAANVLDAMADALIRNAGRNPLDGKDALADVWDATACVRHAMAAGFGAAITMLRIDGRYDKRPSTQEGLRGGTGPIGSPKGMPGDIPPLM